MTHDVIVVGGGIAGLAAAWDLRNRDVVVLEAADRDYRLIVVKDCCADLDTDLHDTLIDKIFPRQATVVSADQLTQALA